MPMNINLTCDHCGNSPASTTMSHQYTMITTSGKSFAFNLPHGWVICYDMLQSSLMFFCPACCTLHGIDAQSLPKDMKEKTS